MHGNPAMETNKKGFTLVEILMMKHHCGQRYFHYCGH
jgi:hypothetical protein